MKIILLILFSTTVAAVLLFKMIKPAYVWEPFVGLLYKNGKYAKRLKPGRYWLNRLFHTYKIQLYYLGERVINVIGQELLTRDNVGLKISIAALYNIENPEIVINKIHNLEEFLHTSIQLTLRKAVAEKDVEEILSKRDEINSQLFAGVEKDLEGSGIKVSRAEIRDIMFPGELKKIFNEVIRAKKEGQAALEKARGETAALRNLANAARMIDNNPNLMNLRVLQAISNASSASGNTFVLGVNQGLIQTPKTAHNKTEESGAEEKQASSPDE